MINFVENEQKRKKIRSKKLREKLKKNKSK